MSEADLPIYMVASSDPQAEQKIMTIGLLDWIHINRVKCFLVDTNIQNPVVFESYHTTIPSTLLSLDSQENWLKLVDICEQHSDRIIVISGTTSVLEQVEQYLKVLLKALPRLSRYFITFWIAAANIDFDIISSYIKATNGRVFHLIHCIFYEEDYEDYSYGKYIESEVEGESRYIAEPTVIDLIRETGIYQRLRNMNTGLINLILNQRIPLKDIYNQYQSKRGQGDPLIDAQWSELFNWHSKCDSIFTDANQIITGYYSLQGGQCGYDRFDQFADEAANNWGYEDIGDLLASNKMDIEYLCAQAAEQEERESVLKIGDAVHFAECERRKIEFFMYETDEERADRERKEAREKDFYEYEAGRPPVGFIPTAEELEIIELFKNGIPF
jgi:hypothetical protein